MKKKLALLVLLVLIIVPVIMVLAISNTVRAYGNDTFYFGSHASSYTIGSTFTIQARLSLSGQMISYTVINGAVLYPSSNLQLVDYSFGHFGTGALTPGDGSLTFRTATASYAGDYSLVNLTFKAIANGNVTLQYSSGTSTSNFVPKQLNPTSFSIYTPPCPSGQIGTWPNCTTPPPPPPTDVCPNISGAQATVPAGMIKDANGNCVYPPSSPPPPPAPKPPLPQQTRSTTPAPVETPPAPAIDDGSIKNVDVYSTITQTTITWEAASQTADYVVKYTDKDGKSAEVAATKTSDNRYSASLEKLSPLQRYEFTIQKASDTKPIYQNSFTTRGFPVIISITSNSQPYSGSFKIDDDEYSTSDGAAYIELTPTEHTIIVSSDAGSLNQKFTVSSDTLSEDGATAKEQDFAFKLQSPSTTAALGWFRWWMLLPLLLIPLAIFLFLLWRRRRQSETTTDHPYVPITDVYDNPPIAANVAEPTDVIASPAETPASTAPAKPLEDSSPTPSQPPADRPSAAPDTATDSSSPTEPTQPSAPPLQVNDYTVANAQQPPSADMPSQTASLSPWGAPIAHDAELSSNNDVPLPQIDLPPELTDRPATEQSSNQTVIHSTGLNIETPPEDMYEAARQVGRFNNLTGKPNEK